MTNQSTTAAHRKGWAEVQRASESLHQAANLIEEANAILDRFFSSRDQKNWDQAFPWKVSELKQALSVCREVENHLQKCAQEAGASSNK